MFQTSTGYAPLIWDRRAVDRTAALPLAGAFISVAIGDALTAELARWGGGYPVMRLCAAVMLIFAACSRSRLTPYYLVVGLLAEGLVALWTDSPTLGLIQGVADAAEVGVFVLVFIHFQYLIIHQNRVTRFAMGVVLAGIAAPALGAAAAASAAWWLLGLPFAGTLQDRVLGDSLAIISLVPPLVALINGDLLRVPQRGALLSTMILAVAGCASTLALFAYSHLPFRFALFSYMVVATFVLPSAGAFVVMLAVVSTAIFGVLAFDGATSATPTLSLGERVIALQFFVAAASLTIMPIAIVLHERDKMAAETKAAREEAERTSRSKSDFLAVVSHEIRNPLGAILGCADILRDAPLTADQSRQLALLQEACQTVIAVTNDILDIARAERGLFAIKAAPFSVLALVESVASLLRPDATEKGLTIQIDAVAAMPAWVIGDGARLRQILFNLVGNAIKYSETGEITIKLLPVAGQSQAYRFEVIDRGPGLTEAEQAQLFIPFARLDNHATRWTVGTGLGLALSKRLVEAMPGGSIGVSSKAAAGATFWFTVELPTSGPPTAVKLVAADDILPIRSLHGLVAEDYVVNQMIVTAILQRAGHRVTVVGNGQQAVAAVAKQHFDIVLMDMEMPVMDGLEATRMIRAGATLDQDIPIIAVTAHAMPREVEECYSAGMSGYLSKPLDSAVLLRKLQELGRPELA
jgi:signal transduction histidine kinase/BarA-like signal transduction histidine kinase